jgi:hypothetical protein
VLEARCRSPVTLQRDLKRARIVLLAAAWRRRAPLIEFLAPDAIDGGLPSLHLWS